MPHVPSHSPQSDAADAGRFLPHPDPPLLPPLPGRYGPGLTLLVRDPYSLFAFWEAPGGPCRLEVCLTGPGDSQCEPVGAWEVPAVGGRYVDLPRAGAHYIATLLTPEGAIRSNQVETPPAGPAPAEEEARPAAACEYWVSRPAGSSSPGLAYAREHAWAPVPSSPARYRRE